MLIVEGPDLVGKTTLCNALVLKILEITKQVDEPIECHVDHFTSADSKMTPLDYYERFVPWTVSDRGHVGEFVYGTVCRDGECHLPPNKMRIVEGMMHAVGGLLVIVHATPGAYEQLLHRHHDRGEEFDQDQCSEINALYNQMAYRKVAVPNTTPDFTHCVCQPDSPVVGYPTANLGWVTHVASRYVALQYSLTNGGQRA